MKQLLQSVSGGGAAVADIPAPRAGRGELLVRVRASLVSAGTERIAVEFAGKNLLQKAIARPDLVRQLIARARRDGILSTAEVVRSRLDADLALGYSNAGMVIEVGEGIGDFRVGDRVACAGLGYASHAEIIRVPRNLAARLPSRSSGEEIDFEEAAFTTLGAIALQAIRLAQPQLGETVAVIGLGLVGVLTVQLLRAAGCSVIGMDLADDRCRLAEQLGCSAVASDASSMRSQIAAQTRGAGADAVIITAATASNAPVELAGEIARDRGRVVAVGAVALEIPRKPYYEKELSFYISRSYGPGRYDPEYEQRGHDYPIGYVRWTENRNLQAFLQLLAENRVDVRRLITHRFPIAQATGAYELISSKTSEPFLGVLITYPEDAPLVRRVDLRPVPLRAAANRVSVGVIGAGTVANGVLLPAMRAAAGTELVGVCTMSGTSAHRAASRMGFRYCTTDEQEILGDPSINTVVIATRHNLHAPQVVAALNAGKHVFCEKPLCLSREELAGIARAHASASRLLMVGFNRRFAPLALKMRSAIAATSEPLLVHYRVNAGFLPSTHWTQTADEGGGRIVGEVCHFVDLISFLTDSTVASVNAAALPNGGRYSNDNVTMTLQMQNGSVATILYAANGDTAFPKERVEVFGGGRVAVLDNFRSLEIVSGGRRRVTRSRLYQDKGHRLEWDAFAAAVRGERTVPITFEQIVNTSLATFAIVEAMLSGTTQRVDSAVLCDSSASPTRLPA